MLDKYGVGQDPYCYPGTQVLRNRLQLHEAQILAQAERDLTEIAASQLDFAPPPYGFDYLKRLHHILFRDLYEWAGQIRTVDISKGGTHFCTVNRVEPEAIKIFEAMAHDAWFEGYGREQLIEVAAPCYGDLNMIHPFREGNGRAQRILFEHLIINVGFEVNWWAVKEDEWIAANVDAVICDYRALLRVFDQCIGGVIDS